MHDARGVSSRERTGDLRSDIEHFTKLHRRFSQTLAQRLAVDEFSGDEIHRVDLLDLMNRDDVWMVQRRSGFCFLHETPHPIMIGRDFGRQNFQSYSSIELCILRQIHLAHSALASWERIS